jgi:DNA repair protein RecO (recombination protein O)
MIEALETTANKQHVRKRIPSNRSTADRVLEEPAFVLHATPYSETSLIVHVFSRHYGRVALIAKGAKRPHSALRQVLLSLQPLLVSWSGKGEVKTLTHATWVGGQGRLREGGLVNGFYLNELLLKLLAREDPHEHLFDLYARALVALGQLEPEQPVLRRFELGLLRELGLGIQLGLTAEGAAISAEHRYACIAEYGVRPCRSGDADIPLVNGSTLLDLEADRFSDPRTLQESKMLMRYLLHHVLAGRTLNTRQILADLHAL